MVEHIVPVSLAAQESFLGGLDMAVAIALGVVALATVIAIVAMAASAMPILYALRNLSRRRVRSLFALVGIAVSISVVVAIVQATRGVENGITDLLNQHRGDVLISQRSSAALASSNLPEDLLREQLAAVPGVERVEGYALRLVNMGVRGTATPDQLAALAELGLEPPEVPAAVIGWEADSRMLAMCQNRDGSGPVRFSSPEANEMALGAIVASQVENRLRALSADPNVPRWVKTQVEDSLGPVGFPDVVLNDVTFRIVAVFETGGLQDTQAVVPLRAFQNAFTMPGVVSAFVLFGDGSRPIPDIVRDARKIQLPGIPLRVIEPIELLSQYSDQYDKLRTMILAIGMLSVVAGAVSIGNTMMSNVHERTREIGLLRSVGWSQGMVLSSILFEGLCLAIVGGVLGIVLGVVELEAAQSVIGYDPTPRGYELPVMLLGLSLAVTLGLLGSLIPGLRACALSPVEAMRHE